MSPAETTNKKCHNSGRDRLAQLTQTRASMSTRVTAGIRAKGSCGSRNVFFGVPPQKSLYVTATGVVDRKLEGGKRAAKGLQSFEEIPHTGRSGWLNLVRFWREKRFQQLHKHMEATFNTLGPIYR